MENEPSNAQNKAYFASMRQNVRAYFKRLDSENLIRWLKEGAWLQFWWLSIIHVANMITNTSFTTPMGKTIFLRDLNPRFSKGFLSHFTSISQKTFNILLPISDALLVIGIFLEALLFYKSKNRNIKLTAQLFSSITAGSLIIAAAIIGSSLIAAKLFLLAILVKCTESLVATFAYGTQWAITGKKRYIRPFIHNFLALTTSVLTFTTLLYLMILIPAIATGPIGIGAAVGIVTAAKLYSIASQLALATTILMAVSLAAKGVDEMVIKPWFKKKAPKAAPSVVPASNLEDNKGITPKSPVKTYSVDKTNHLNEMKIKTGLPFFHQEHRAHFIQNLCHQSKYKEAKEYLLDEIDDKISNLEKLISGTDEKIRPNMLQKTIEALYKKNEDRCQKISLLQALKKEINGDGKINIQEIKNIVKAKKYQRAQRSKLRAVGDTEDLILAVFSFAKEYENHHDMQTSFNPTPQHD